VRNNLKDITIRTTIKQRRDWTSVALSEHENSGASEEYFVIERISVNNKGTKSARGGYVQFEKSCYVEMCNNAIAPPVVSFF